MSSIDLSSATIEVVTPETTSVPKQRFNLDIVQSHLFLERWAKPSKLTKEDETEEVPTFIRAFIEWIKDTYQAQLTVSQSWKLTQAVHIEFLKLKKNYDQELSVVMNLEPTPSLSLKDKSISSPNQTQRVFRNSPDLEQNENSLTEE